jgi:hypothetical protein
MRACLLVFISVRNGKYGRVVLHVKVRANISAEYCGMEIYLFDGEIIPGLMPQLLKNNNKAKIAGGFYYPYHQVHRN